MKDPKVFVISSTEGLDAADTVRALLLDTLRDRAEIRPWTREFELSAVYVESLEKASQDADFAVVLITPDDLTASRGKKQPSPRDNVVFELGLFMGALGRHRCFLIEQETPELKRPSDLLGVNAATFRRANDVPLTRALDLTCLRIASQVKERGCRIRVPDDVLLRQSGDREFCRAMAGYWWELVPDHQDCTLTLFRIDYEDGFHTLSLNGKAYDKQGTYQANWRSNLARVDLAEQRILYHWSGWFAHPEKANLTFQGFGEMEFERPLDRSAATTGGTGRYWEVNENSPEKTRIRTTKLRRVADPRVVTTMSGGNEKTIASVVQKTISEW